jgi:TonB family protein
LKSPDGQQGDVVILSDTMGVDFGPYVQPMVPEIRKNWLRLMPESARSPVSKSGQVAMEFAILKDGRVTGLTMKVSSGDDALDRAVRSAILESRPFSPLPSIFRGQYLLLRMTFHYNSSTTPQTPPAGAPSGKAARPDGTVSPKNL